MNVETYRRKDLLSIRELEPEEISFLLDQTDSFREINERDIKKVPTLRGKPSSTCSSRTARGRALRSKSRASAFRRTSSPLGLHEFDEQGETLRDTARNIEAMATDVLVVRHWASGAPAYLGGSLAAPS